MCPSGKMRQLSVLSWGRASARYGRALSWSSTVSSSALKTRTTKDTLAPANVTGRLARLVGSTRTTATNVWLGRALEAGAWPGAVETWEEAGAQPTMAAMANSTIASMRYGLMAAPPVSAVAHHKDVVAGPLGAPYLAVLPT